jgi:phosphoribosyl-AMP cyclohydrolase/phosphoribosyl-ATP pyrophosphohydrolase/phosphoribosyl-AMP cyclohydrolase
MTAEYTATPIPFTEDELAAVHFDGNGLIAAIAQDADTKDVLMVAWMNADALRRTLETGRGWYWSRSRNELWCKGETSGDRQFVRSVAYDCDMDAVLLQIDQVGGACHSGERSCFFRSFGSGAEPGRA